MQHFFPGLKYNMGPLSRWRVQLSFCIKSSYNAICFIYCHNLRGFRHNLLKDISSFHSGNNDAEQLPMLTKSLLTRRKTDKSIKTTGVAPDGQQLKLNIVKTSSKRNGAHFHATFYSIWLFNSPKFLLALHKIM